ncbi:MAG: calcium-binding protein [Hyphomicrobium sp.]|jgi:Ca2+-binding RTX toxin-like protein
MATPEIPFVNAPGSTTLVVGNSNVTYQNHHVISNQAFGDSTFLQALQEAGLWRQEDFRLNGLQLPSAIGGVNINQVPNRDQIVGEASHTGGHASYNNSQIEILRNFDTRLRDLSRDPSLNWDGAGTREAWLAREAPKIYGYVSFLKTELTNPNSTIKLHGTDKSVTDLDSGKVWGEFAKKYFDGETLSFSDGITTNSGYRLGASGTYFAPNGSLVGALGGSLTLFDATHGTGTTFDKSFVRSVGDVTNALHNGPLNISPTAPGLFAIDGTSRVNKILGSDALLIALAIPAAIKLFADHAQARGLDPSKIDDIYTAGVELGLSVTSEQFNSIVAAAAGEIAVSASLGVVGVGQKLFKTLLHGEDVVDVIKLYETANPDNSFIGSLSDLTRRLEATAVWRAYKQGTDTINHAIESFLNGITTPIAEALTPDSLSRILDLGQTGQLPQNVVDDFARGVAAGVLDPANAAHVELIARLSSSLANGDQLIAVPGGHSGTFASGGLDLAIGEIGRVQSALNQAIANGNRLEVEARLANLVGNLQSGLAGTSSSLSVIAPILALIQSLPTSLPSSQDLDRAFNETTSALNNVRNTSGSLGTGPSTNTNVSIPAGWDTVYQIIFDEYGEFYALGATQAYAAAYSAEIGGAPTNITPEKFYLQNTGYIRQLNFFDANGNAVLLPVSVIQVGAPGASYLGAGKLVVYDADGNPVGIRTRDGIEVSRTRDATNANSWRTAVRLPSTDLVLYNEITAEGATIGTFFGTALAQAIPTDDVFSQVAVGSVLAAVGKNFGQAIDAGLTTALSVSDIVGQTLADFSSDLAGAFRNQALGAVSGFLLGELAESLGFDGSGFGDQLLRSTAGSITQTVLNNVAQSGLVDPFAGLIFDGSNASIANATQFGVGISTFIGGYIAREIVAPETVAGSIGGSIGGFFGTAIGAGIAGSGGVLGSIGSGILTAAGLSNLILTTASTALGIILPGVGALIGTVLGTLIGNIWTEGWGDDHGSADGRASLASGAGQFVNETTVGDDSVFIRAVEPIRNGISTTVNQFLAVIGGTNASTDTFVLDVHNQANPDGPFNTKHYYWFEIGLRTATGAYTQIFRTTSTLNWTPLNYLETASILVLKNLDIAGGNLFLRRALENSTATTLAGLSGDLKIAEDYARYLANQPLIDSLISLDPTSTFAAGWIVTLLRAEELRLGELSSADFSGGVAGFVASIDPRRPELAGADVSIAVVNGELLLTFTPLAGGEPVTEAIGNYHELTGLTSLAPSSTGALVTGTAGNDLWIALGDVASTFSDSASAINAASHDALIGGGGNDVIDAGAGSDFVSGGAGNDTIVGGLGNDLLLGGSGSDSITGGEGADIIGGGRSADALNGGAGDDSYLIARGDGPDTIVETAGADSIRFSADIAANDLALRFEGNDLLVAIRPLTSPTATFDELPERIRLSGWANSDTRVETFIFADGTQLDTLQILDLTEIQGARTLSIDGKTWSVQYDAANAQPWRWQSKLTAANGTVVRQATRGDDGKLLVEEWGTAAADTIYTDGLGGVSYTAFGGAGNDRILGNQSADRLYGEAGNDTLDGGAGPDTLIGGAGNDTYVFFGNDDDVITELANEGTDTLQSYVTVDALAANVEYLTLVGLSAVNGTGNAANNTITGNDADNVLNGGGGNDTLIGGKGNDTYVVDSTSDIVTELDNAEVDVDGVVMRNAATAASEGIDTVQTSVWLQALHFNIENLTLTGTVVVGQGNELNNVIRGNSANNALDGGLGDDRIYGGAGADTISGGDVEASDGFPSIVGFDIAAYDDEVSGLTIRLDTPSLNTGAAAGDIYFGIEGIVGGSGNDLIAGNSANNYLSGSAGNDTLIGGAGNDTYVVDSILDVVTEAAGGGVDTVETSVSIAALAANVENLTLTGALAINGTGNSLSNRITGNSANNVLEATPGFDALIGGDGDDTYVVDTPAYLVEKSNGGIDTVRTALATYRITGTFGAAAPTYIENLIGTASTGQTLIGNADSNIVIGGAGADTISGGAGNDTLDGGAGADKLIGEAGNDTYVVDSTLDVVTEAANSGIDTVKSSVSITALAANVENLTLTGALAINGTGNALNNVITGNSADNVLNGGAGSDVYSFSVGAGHDTVNNEGSDTASTDLIRIAGTGYDEVWLGRSGNDLIVSLLGHEDTLRVLDWYSSATTRVDRIEISGGRSISAVNVDQLVNAMAGFSTANGIASAAIVPGSIPSAVGVAINSSWAA